MTTDEQKKVRIQLETCSSDMDKLNDWEQNFIESISDQFDRHNSLSEVQVDKLNTIYEKVIETNAPRRR